MNYYLAVDIGASSGRHIIGSVQNGSIVIEEIYRFENGFTKKDGVKVWDTDKLFDEILAGLKKCKEIGKIPQSMGIDTWGVDFVLLDEKGERIGECVAYRDDRNIGMDREVSKVISEKELYIRTGIQKAVFNTIYQLAAIQKNTPMDLERAHSLLMMPDYLHYLLTGKKSNEYTNATTSNMINVHTGDWDFDLIEQLGFPKRIFGKLHMPGTYLADLKEEVQREVGFTAKVVSPATHDTASAVMSIPMSEDAVYISSGTWSLMGCESKAADTGEKAYNANFTNEGGYAYRYRFLKNIMGLWLIQSARKEFLEQAKKKEIRFTKEDLSFARLCEMAGRQSIRSIVDAKDERFMAPDSMVSEIQTACRETGQQVPKTPFETAKVIYDSLAHSYKETLEEIEEITGKSYTKILIVGGGSNASYLNKVTADITGREVRSGICEATAIGNLGAQMIHSGEFKDIEEFRGAVQRAFMA